MQAMGFTVVRLLVAVPGVMPARGVVNATYLDEVAQSRTTSIAHRFLHPTHDAWT
jgi:hypothetical protein